MTNDTPPVLPAATARFSPRLRSVMAQMGCAVLLWVALLGVFAGAAAETRVSLRGLVFSCMGDLCLEDEAGRVYRLKGKGLQGFKGQLVDITGFSRRERGELRLRPLACRSVASPPERRETESPALATDGRDFQG